MRGAPCARIRWPGGANAEPRALRALAPCEAAAWVPRWRPFRLMIRLERSDERGYVDGSRPLRRPRIVALGRQLAKQGGQKRSKVANPDRAFGQYRRQGGQDGHPRGNDVTVMTVLTRLTPGGAARGAGSN